MPLIEWDSCTPYSFDICNHHPTHSECLLCSIRAVVGRYADHIREALAADPSVPEGADDGLCRVVLLTNDADNRARAMSDGLYAVSVRDYVRKDLKCVPRHVS